VRAGVENQARLQGPSRHVAEYKRAKDGDDTRSLRNYLAHVNIQHTVRYSELLNCRQRDLKSYSVLGNSMFP
jgi:hypothetical protein